MTRCPPHKAANDADDLVVDHVEVSAQDLLIALMNLDYRGGSRVRM